MIVVRTKYLPHSPTPLLFSFGQKSCKDRSLLKEIHYNQLQDWLFNLGIARAASLGGVLELIWKKMQRAFEIVVDFVINRRHPLMNVPISKRQEQVDQKGTSRPINAHFYASLRPRN